MKENYLIQMRGDWSYPTNIKFGCGRVSELHEVCCSLNIKNPLFITDRKLATLEVTKRVLNLLSEANIGFSNFSEIDTNPTEINLANAIDFYKAGKHDGVIAFGGGSGLDIGKMVAFMFGQTRPLWDFEDVADWWKRANHDIIAPIIAVPTTAGTGSEVGRASVITNSQSYEKKIIFHPKVMPSVVICDPELTVGMPSEITAGTGLDAFAHCVEAFSSPNYHPMSNGIAIEGMRLVVENLPKAYNCKNDLHARSNMMCAAMMGATAFQKGLGAIHAMSHPIGALFNTHHGTTNAICMLPVLRLNSVVIKHRFDEVASYLGIKGGFEGFCNFVQDFNLSLGIPSSLSDLGIEKSDINILVSKALQDPSCHGNPVELNSTNMKLLFERAL